MTHDLGSWSPLDVGETVRSFAGAPFRWWVTGGHALELHLGTSWRRHADVDIGICRCDAGQLHQWLDGWDLHIGADGRLTPWSGGPLEASRNQNNIWCRPAPTDDWRLDVVVGAGTGELWIYRRDESVTRPWDEAVLHSAEGVPYLAPELQLLFKSKGLRDKDHDDARHVIPRLDAARQQSLAALLLDAPGCGWCTGRSRRHAGRQPEGGWERDERRWDAVRRVAADRSRLRRPVGGGGAHVRRDRRGARRGRLVGGRVRR